MKRILLFTLLASIAGTTLAKPATLMIPGIKVLSKQTSQYRCDDDQRLAVQYLNTDGSSLAVLSVDGKNLVFVNVIAASGAKYVSGHYIWWTKGKEANLYDGFKPESAAPLYANCTTK